MQIILASGPYTSSTSLGFSGLIDLLAVVKKDKPHALILMGPFLDINNEGGIKDAEIYYED